MHVCVRNDTLRCDNGKYLSGEKVISLMSTYILNNMIPILLFKERIVHFLNLMR